MVPHVPDLSRTGRVLARIASGSLVVAAAVLATAAWQYVVTGRIDVFLAANTVLFGAWAVVAARTLVKRQRGQACRGCDAIWPIRQAFCPRCGRKKS